MVSISLQRWHKDVERFREVRLAEILLPRHSGFGENSICSGDIIMSLGRTMSSLASANWCIKISLESVTPGHREMRH